MREVGNNFFFLSQLREDWDTVVTQSGKKGIGPKGLQHPQLTPTELLLCVRQRMN